MDLKKNIFYNGLLTISNYIVPILVFPHVTRVLGVDNFGIFSFVDSIVNYFMIFAMMGISTIGIREIAKFKEDKKKLNDVFSNIFSLNIISTLIILIIFLACIFIVKQFHDKTNILAIGSAKIIANLFLIEWLFIGAGDFKFIALRSILIRTLYVASVFIFIKVENDYTLYYILTVLSVVLNATVNWKHSKKIIKFSFNNINFKPYISSFLILGSYMVLTSLYTTFNVIFLGFSAGEKEVGFYMAAVKIQGILLSIFSSYTMVIMPHMSFVFLNSSKEKINEIINNSFEALYIFGIPTIIIAVYMAPELIQMFSGSGYEGAILPMRIVVPLVLLIGIEQILIVQILTPLGKDKAILFNSILGAFFGLVLNLILVRYLKSTGSALVWAISELVVLISAKYFVFKYINFKIDYKLLAKNLLVCIPYLLFCSLVKMLNYTSVLTLLYIVILSAAYFIFSVLVIFRNKFAITLVKKIF